MPAESYSELCASFQGSPGSPDRIYLAAHDFTGYSLSRGPGDTIFFIIISGVAREKNSLGNCMGKEPSAGTQSTALSAPRAVGHISSILKKKCICARRDLFMFRCVRLWASSVKGLFSIAFQNKHKTWRSIFPNQHSSEFIGPLIEL